MTTRSAAAPALTLGLAAACWLLAVRQMTGMDMGPGTALGSIGYFAALWVPMMAAMMLPGAVPAVVRRVRSGARGVVVLAWVASYLAVWTVLGLALYLAYRPHGSLVAAAVVLLAGGYELTPMKRSFRRRCREDVPSGFEFGLCCVGSSIGLMFMLLALGPMSLTWMSLLAIVVLGQKLLPLTRAIDLPLALLIVGFGVWIALAPGSVPVLSAAM